MQFQVFPTPVTGFTYLLSMGRASTTADGVDAESPWLNTAEWMLDNYPVDLSLCTLQVQDCQWCNRCCVFVLCVFVSLRRRAGG